jgi:hypothetical protein
MTDRQLKLLSTDVLNGNCACNKTLQKNLECNYVPFRRGFMFLFKIVRDKSELDFLLYSYRSKF